jgi:HEPN domain-containing protein
MWRRQTKASQPADWFAIAEERLRAVDLLWAHEGGTPSGIECLQELVERFLKGYLIAKGWRLVKTHDLERLVSEAQKYERRFSASVPLAEQLTADFFAQHYPGGDLTSIGLNYETLRQQTGEVIALIKEEVPQYFPKPPAE